MKHFSQMVNAEASLVTIRRVIVDTSNRGQRSVGAPCGGTQGRSSFPDTTHSCSVSGGSLLPRLVSTITEPWCASDQAPTQKGLCTTHTHLPLSLGLVAASTHSGHKHSLAPKHLQVTTTQACLSKVLSLETTCQRGCHAHHTLFEINTNPFAARLCLGTRLRPVLQAGTQHRALKQGQTARKEGV